VGAVIWNADTVADDGEVKDRGDRETGDGRGKLEGDVANPGLESGGDEVLNEVDRLCGWNVTTGDVGVEVDIEEAAAVCMGLDLVIAVVLPDE